MNYFEDPKVRLILAVAIVIIIWYFWTSETEHYTNEMKQLDATIVPPYVDTKSGSLMSGTDFSGFPHDNNVLNLIPEYQHKPYQTWGLDDGSESGQSLGIHYNLCSKSCCSSQYKTPFQWGDAELENKGFVPTNLTCSNSVQDVGCACMQPDQYKFLVNRGNNA